MAERRISLMRKDVGANVEVFKTLCERAGLNVLIVETVRSPEEQLKAYSAGYSKTKIPTFHATHAGLAFDVCKNVKGQEYSDNKFFEEVGKIGELVGFSWGGRWKSFPDRPHFQWDAHGKFNGSDIIAKRYPPTMPLYKLTDGKEEKKMDENRIREIIREEVRMMNDTTAGLPPSPWAVAAWEKVVGLGIFDGKNPRGYVTREQVAAVLDRAGILSNP